MKKHFFAAIACLTLVLSAPADAENEDKVHQFKSRSGKLEFVARNQSELWFSRVGRRATKRLLFTETNGLLMGATCSADDRLIVVGWGGASAGHHLELLLRQKSGRYARLQMDFAEEVWEAVAKALKLPEDAEPAHVHCHIVTVRSRPLAVIGRVSGNYLADGMGQTGFTETYFRYEVETNKLRIIPKPPEAHEVSD